MQFTITLKFISVWDEKENKRLAINSKDELKKKINLHFLPLVSPLILLIIQSFLESLSFPSLLYFLKTILLLFLLPLPLPFLQLVFLLLFCKAD